MDSESAKYQSSPRPSRALLKHGFKVGPQSDSIEERVPARPPEKFVLMFLTEHSPGASCWREPVEDALQDAGQMETG